MSIKHYQLAKDEEPPDEFCVVRDVGGEPSEYTFYVPDSENVKLRKQYEAVIVDYRAEVAKLRELVGDIWEFGFSNSAGASSVKEWYRVRDELEQRVYAALGVDE